MRVLSTLMSLSYEKESFKRVDAPMLIGQRRASIA